MTELKQINWAEKQFTANGKTYHISTQYSIYRSVYAEEAKIEMETGVRVGRTMSEWQTVFELLNAGKLAEASVHAYNQMKAINGFYERPDPVLRLAACYVNYEGEDVRTISDEIVNQKKIDWAEEGYTIQSFFLLALTFIAEETADLKNITHHISNLIKNFSKEMEKVEPNIPILES